MSVSCTFAKTEPLNSPGASTGPYQGFGYPWENNDLGLTDEVPSPWTPLKYTNQSVSCWGRTYKLGKGPLPAQILTQKMNLFSKPPSLMLQIDGQQILLGKTTLTHKSKGSTSFISSKKKASFEVKVKGRLDYDGLWKVTLTIDPRQAVQIDQLRIKLPFNPNIAKSFNRYLTYDFNLQRMDRHEFAESYGAINSLISMPFNPAIWIGNRSVGMEWVCESDQGWSTQTPEKAIEIKPSNAHTLMTFNVVTKPLKIDSPYTLTFALYPSPIKPLPKDWRLKRLIHSYHVGTLDPSVQDVYGLAWANVPVKYIGLPVMTPSDGVKDKKLAGKRYIEDPQAMIEQTRRHMKKLGIKFIPYGSFYMMPAKLPLGEWKDYALYWTSRGTLDDRQTVSFNPRWATMLGLSRKTRSLVNVTIAPKSLRDFFVWHYVQAIQKEDIDGTYIDGSDPMYFSQNPLHPGGNHVAKGGQYYSFFAKRKLMQRLWIACKKLKPDFFITQHGSKPTLIGSGFVDLTLSGEPINVFFRGKNWSPKTIRTDPNAYNSDYSRISEEFFAINYSPMAGTINMLISQVLKGNSELLANDPERYKRLSRTLLARTTVYDIPMYPQRVDENIMKLINTAYRHFDWLKNTRFIAPPSSILYLKSAPESLRYGLYLHTKKEKVMLVVSNLGNQPVKTQLKLNIAQLSKDGVSLAKNASWFDATTSKPTQMRTMDDLAIQLSVPANDFKIFIVE